MRLNSFPGETSSLARKIGHPALWLRARALALENSEVKYHYFLVVAQENGQIA